MDLWTEEKKKEGSKTYLEDTYQGETPINTVTEYTYLGFVISNSGDNMANILEVKKKSIGVTKKISEKF